MRKSFVRLMDKDRYKGVHLSLDEEEVCCGEMVYNGGRILIKNGVPVFSTGGGNAEQIKTNETFSAKWNIFQTEYNETEYNYNLKFVLKRLQPLNIYSEKEWIEFLEKQKMILDAGSGMGWMSKYMAEHTKGIVVSAEIGDGAFAAYEKCSPYENCHVIKADLNDLPFADNTFDFIFSDGVLHHTPDTKLAMKALYDKCKPGGAFWFYIYKEMNPVKKFCDDYIRSIFTKMTPDEALEQCKAITDLGRELSNLQGKICLERPIEVLNIPAGTYDVQRFFYYNFMKCYWNEDIGYELSNVVNFDWYHPNSAQQQTEEQVHAWMKEYGIENYKIYIANPNGMNVVIFK